MIIYEKHELLLKFLALINNVTDLSLKYL